MSMRIVLRRRRLAAIIGAGAALAGGATALAASPAIGGRYAGTTSEGHGVALRVVANGTRAHWIVRYGRNGNCQPPRFTSQSGQTFDRRFGAPIDGSGRYRETISATNSTKFNGHSGYKVRVRARFSGRFVDDVTAKGRFEQRSTFFRPDGSQLATCVRHLTYTATLR
jgi:hypothetical protein